VSDHAIRRLGQIEPSGAAQNPSGERAAAAPCDTARGQIHRGGTRSPSAAVRSTRFPSAVASSI